MTMDRNISVELIKSYVLGCLNPEAEKGLKSFMEDTENFPWQELGQYQNLVAMLPLNLSFETPGLEVKDRVARKLYELRGEPEITQQAGEEIIISEQILADGEPQVLIDESPQEFLEEISPPELSEEIPEKTEILIEENLVVKEPEIPPKSKEETIEKIVSPTVEEHRRGSKMRDILEREEFEKRTREYINTYYQIMFEDIRSELKKVFFVAIAGLALAIVAIIISFIV